VRRGRSTCQPERAAITRARAAAYDTSSLDPLLPDVGGPEVPRARRVADLNRDTVGLLEPPRGLVGVPAP
jgi:hypothetical protein